MGGYTGVYKMVGGKLEKISDRIPSLSGVFDVTGWKGGYYSDALGCYVESKEHKRQLMQQQGVVETTIADVQNAQKAKPSVEQRQKQIESKVATYLNDKGVERFRVKNISEVFSNARRNGDTR